MKKLLNTLFVTTPKAYLSKEGETVVVSVDKEVKLRVPIHMLAGIVCFGYVTVSPPLMGFCGERGVALSLLSDHGQFLARIQGPVSGNVLLRREQYRRADDLSASASMARALVLAKVANGRTVLQRALRDHPEMVGRDEVESSIRRQTFLLDQIRREESLDAIRGLEGDAAHSYFNVFDHLILTQKECFFFRTRSRRPPLDNMNALLSFLYTLVMHDMTAALEAVGLDPSVGFLHRDRPGRPGLALDLMEEFRPFLADRLALSLVNLRQVNGSGFRTAESGAVFMDDDTRKTLLVAYQNRKQEEILHPFIGEKAPVGLLFHLQALLLARFLRGDLDGYPPFVWR